MVQDARRLYSVWLDGREKETKVELLGLDPNDAAQTWLCWYSDIASGRFGVTLKLCVQLDGNSTVYVPVYRLLMNPDPEQKKRVGGVWKLCGQVH